MMKVVIWERKLNIDGENIDKDKDCHRKKKVQDKIERNRL